jgi:hypothetical protein
MFKRRVVHDEKQSNKIQWVGFFIGTPKTATVHRPDIIIPKSENIFNFVVIALVFGY